MDLPLVIFILCYVLSLIVLIAALLRAPEGFEDEQGFHRGRQPKWNKATH